MGVGKVTPPNPLRKLSHRTDLGREDRARNNDLKPKQAFLGKASRRSRCSDPHLFVVVEARANGFLVGNTEVDTYSHSKPTLLYLAKPLMREDEIGNDGQREYTKRKVWMQIQTTGNPKPSSPNGRSIAFVRNMHKGGHVGCALAFAPTGARPRGLDEMVRRFPRVLVGRAVRQHWFQEGLNT